MSTEATFLETLTQAFRDLDSADKISTKEFAAACAKILPIFDYLGTVFVFAKSELNSKRDSLVAVQDKLVTLNDVVAADTKKGTVTTKNSESRNLFRLLNGVLFISRMLQNLIKDSKCTLRTACGDAYTEVLANMHSYLVRSAVRASMYMLPTREQFLHSVKETEESVKAHAEKLCPAVEELVAKAGRLFEGTNMPASDTKWLPAAAPA